MTTGQSSTIAIVRFRELWVHTGTACNLSCPFCHEGSKPGDTRIEAPTAAEIAPLLAEAAALGVERFAFTGGEPLILKGIKEILLQALALRPVLVLTNGTAPLIRRSHQLAELAAAPHKLSFRVSIDYPDEARHDSGRGFRNFRKALEGLGLLHAAGFAVGIARQMTADEERTAVEAAFQKLLRRHQLPQDLPIISLPELDLPGGAVLSHEVPLEQLAAQSPACSFSRMVLRQGGNLHFQACPMTDDALRFRTGATLDTALKARVVPDHSRCRRCLDQRMMYSEIDRESESEAEH